MASAATGCDSTVTELSAGKSGHASGGHQSAWHTVDVAQITGRCSRHVNRRQTANGFWVDPHKGTGCHIRTMANGTGHDCTRVIEFGICKFGTIWHWRTGNAGVRAYVATLATEGTHGDVPSWN